MANLRFYAQEIDDILGRADKATAATALTSTDTLAGLGDGLYTATAEVASAISDSPVSVAFTLRVLADMYILILADGSDTYTGAPGAWHKSSSGEDTTARAAIAEHIADKSNPHEVTKAQVGLGNVDNVATKDVLVKLVDSGAKNRMDLSQPETVRDTAYSSLADGGVNLSCSNKVWTQYTVVVPVISGKDFTFAMKIANVNGDLSSGYIYVRDENNNNYFQIHITAAGEYVKTFTATTNTVRVFVYLNNSSTAKTVSLDAYGMLCTTEDYAISPAFVPHRPSYDELVARIEALESGGN